MSIPQNETLRAIIEGTDKIERLTVELTCRQLRAPINVERVLLTVFRAVETYGLTRQSLPRGYYCHDNKNFKHGYVMKYQSGLQVDTMQLGIDFASGWLEEFAGLLNDELIRRYPAPMLESTWAEASQEEEGG